MNLGQFMALEAYNEENNIDTVIDPAEFPAPIEEETFDASTDIVEDGIGALESIEKIQGVLTSVKESQLSSEGVKLLNIYVDDMRRHLGLEDVVKLPALEAFQSVHTGTAAVNIAIEEFGDLFKKIWTGIVNFFKRIWDAIVGFFKGAVQEAEEKRQAAWKKQIDAHMAKIRKNKNLPEGEIRNNMLTQQFTLPGMQASVKNVLLVAKTCEDTIAVSKDLDRAMTTYSKGINECLDSLEDFIKNPSKLQAYFDNVEKLSKAIESQINPLYNKHFAKIEKVHFSPNVKEVYQSHPEAKEVLATDFFIGGAQILFFKITSGKYYTYYDHAATPASSLAVVKEGSFRYPNYAELQEVVDKKNNVCDALNEHKKVFKTQHSRELEEAKNKMDSILNLANNHTSGTAGDRAEIIKLCRTQSELMNKFTSTLLNLATSVHRHVKHSADAIENFINVSTKFLSTEDIE